MPLIPVSGRDHIHMSEYAYGFITLTDLDYAYLTVQKPFGAEAHTPSQLKNLIQGLADLGQVG